MLQNSHFGLDLLSNPHRKSSNFPILAWIYQGTPIGNPLNFDFCLGLHSCWKPFTILHKPFTTPPRLVKCFWGGKGFAGKGYVGKGFRARG